MDIILNPATFTYNKETKTFTISEKDVPFATEYHLVNKTTGNRKLFSFSHSTGSEWDVDTKYIYKSTDGITLEVCNDEEITKKRSEMYLQAKLNN